MILCCNETEVEGHSFVSDKPRTQKPLSGDQTEDPIDGRKEEDNNGRTGSAAPLLGKKKAC